MTDTAEEAPVLPDLEPLPTVVTVSKAFTTRLPAQRLLDLVKRLEPGENFGDIATEQPFRLIAFRALLRDYPDRDTTSLWLHAYDVEVDVTEDDPFIERSSTPWPVSAATGT